MASRTDYRTYNEWVFSLPKQWRQYTSSVLRSSRERTQIIFPSDTDDETFDNFVLRKHCKNFQCSPTPKQLKGKEKEVNRRGRENLGNMKKTDFVLRTDGQGRRYYLKVAQYETKHHRGSDVNAFNASSARIYEIPGDEKSPVSSLEKYLGKLNPHCESFWQRLKRNTNDSDAVLELCDCIAKCLEKKMVLIKLGQMSLENKSWQSDMQTAIAEKLEAQKLLEDNKVETLRFKDQVEKLTKIVRDIKMEITQERERSSKMSLKLQEITKDKEDLLIRLSKIAGSKLTSNNPDIADLSDDNRPTKLAEKFGQLYDDAWTDSLEELTDVETKLDEGVAIGFLLQIILAAYQFCRSPRSMFLDLTDCQTIMTCANLKDMKVLIKITESSKVDIQPRMKMSLHAKETVSEMQKNFFGILKGIFNDIKRTNKFRPSVSDELNTNSWEVDEVKETNPLDNHFTTNVYKKDVINVLQRSKEEPANMLRHTEFSICKKLSNSAKGDFLQPRCKTNPQDGFALKKEEMQTMLTFPFKSKAESAGPKTRFPKTTHFAERCVELCWFMQTTQPPIHLSARIPNDGRMNNDIFRAYMKSGTEVDYIVWPAMYLHENGPLLSKGIAQPK
ncbi:uncharacterized protein LOC128157230 isoform X3 [Crassostrea angulata]|uniref:uncharacterized protein LOC128157230 isoform X3 n=1 Tax=Magallana angulata TaxID=2784310 RepID=UPI0022B0DD31|nr:uncharacterized protein LOC128157230 isoform X3 [Crassostrea angulata]